MYAFPYVTDAHERLWQAIASRLRQFGVADVPAHLSLEVDHLASWRDPALLLGQACEYPLLRSFGAYLRAVATPCYTAPGCTGSHYRSAIIVRADDPARTLADVRGGRCAVNDMESNSGMNLLRAALAPLAAAKAYFAAVVVSGSHKHSAAMVADGAADVAALDCVTFAHLTRSEPTLTSRLRVLDWTPSSPALPLVTARGTSETTLAALRAALAGAIADPALASTREQLFLAGFDYLPDAQLSITRKLERQASVLGYPVLE